MRNPKLAHILVTLLATNTIATRKSKQTASRGQVTDPMDFGTVLIHLYCYLLVSCAVCYIELYRAMYQREDLDCTHYTYI